MFKRYTVHDTERTSSGAFKAAKCKKAERRKEYGMKQAYLV